MKTKVTRATVADITRLVDYLYADEARSYMADQQNGFDTHNHIFLSVDRVLDWLDTLEKSK
jgi:hypothetical protein